MTVRENDDVVVSWLFVPPSTEAIDALSRTLNDSERDSARRFVFARDANLFVTAHALLRHTLWRATGVSNWQFSTNRFGKPELDPPFGSPHLRFNLAHSASLAVCAICYGYDIGVDVEAIADDFQLDGVARHYFTAHECAQLDSCPPHERRAAFLRIWTLKEALIKATGRGLSEPLDNFEITLDPLMLSTPAAYATAAERWHIEQRALSPSHWASVAVCRSTSTALSVRWRTTSASEVSGTPANSTNRANP